MFSNINYFATARVANATSKVGESMHPSHRPVASPLPSSLDLTLAIIPWPRPCDHPLQVGDSVYGAPDNDRKMKESSWISSQAWFESLRYYPKGEAQSQSHASLLIAC